MKKRLISTVSAAILAVTGVCNCAVIPFNAKAITSFDFQEDYTRGEDDNWMWCRFEDHVAVIYYKGNRSTVAIPETIEGLPVTIVTDEVFRWNHDIIKKLSIPATVTDIGSSLSAVIGLSEVDIAEGNKNYIVENNAVYTADKSQLLKCLTYTEGEFNIPDTVKVVKDSAFMFCYDITSINIPSSVTEIGINAMLGCNNLESISVDEKNKEYSSADGVLFDINKEILYQYPVGNKRKSYSVPDSVTEIDTSAFQNSDNLEAVEFGKNVECIDDLAFYDCDKLNNVVLCDSVDTIGYSAFSLCANLFNITFPDNITTVMTYALADTPWFSSQPDGIIYIGKVLYKVKGRLPENSVVTVKEGTIGIADYAFCTEDSDYAKAVLGDKNLVAVKLPEGIKSINQYAFHDCSNLKEINLPDSISQIAPNAFNGCSSLKEIHIPKSMTYIEWSVFSSCSSLEAVEIPANIQSIQNNAFGDCTSLKSLTIYNKYCYLSDPFGFDEKEYPMSDTDFRGTIYGYDDSFAQSYAKEYGYKFVSLGKEENNGNNYPDLEKAVKSDGKWEWLEFEDHAAICGYNSESETMDIPDTLNGLPVTEIYSEFYLQKPSVVKSVNIPANLTKLNGLFYSLDKLEDISVDKDNNSFVLENGVLYNADKTDLIKCLKSKVKGEFSISSTVVNIESGAFEGCSEITAINIPASVSYISDSFNGCTSVEAVNVSKRNNSYSSADGVLFDKIKDYLIFYPPKCPSSSFTIPESVVWIASKSFNNCDNLESVKLPENLMNIPYAAFMDCDKLDNVVIPKKVTEIEHSAFENCSALKNIEFTDNVSMIGFNALAGTAWLKNQPDGPVYIGSVFYKLKDDDSKITEITIKDGTEYISPYAFCKSTVHDTEYSVTIIDNTSLKSVILPDGVKYLGGSAFSGCTALTDISLPDSIDRSFVSSEGIFSGCASLKDIVLSSNSTKIYSSDYSNCASLKDIVIPERVTTIYSWAFEECASLESVTILNPDCVIYGEGFTICNSITEPDDINGDYIPNYSGTICGYDNSTAEKYAKDCGYKFKSLGKAPNRLGDINDDEKINAVDASEVLSYYARISTNKDGGFTDEQKKAADVNKDGLINAVDASCILSYYAYTSTTKDTLKKTLEDFLK